MSRVLRKNKVRGWTRENITTEVQKILLQKPRIKMMLITVFMYRILIAVFIYRVLIAVFIQRT